MALALHILVVYVGYLLAVDTVQLLRIVGSHRRQDMLAEVIEQADTVAALAEILAVVWLAVAAAVLVDIAAMAVLVVDTALMELLAVVVVVVVEALIHLRNMVEAAVVEFGYMVKDRADLVVDLVI